MIYVNKSFWRNIIFHFFNPSLFFENEGIRSQNKSIRAAVTVLNCQFTEKILIRLQSKQVLNLLKKITILKNEVVDLFLFRAKLE